MVPTEDNLIKKVSVKAINGVRYTVPQVVDVYENTEDIKIYFRVGAVMKDVKIVAKCNGETILSNKKRKVAPGEMEVIKLTKEMVEKLDGELTIEIEK